MIILQGESFLYLSLQIKSNAERKRSAFSRKWIGRALHLLYIPEDCH